MTAYLLTSAILLGLLGAKWDKRPWYDFLVKCSLLGICGWGIVLALMELGFVWKS